MGFTHTLWYHVEVTIITAWIPQRLVLISIKEQFMKEYSILMKNVSIEQYQKEILYDKESSSWRNDMCMWTMSVSSNNKGKSWTAQKKSSWSYEISLCQCHPQATSKGDLSQHKRAIHKGIKFSLRLCQQQATAKGDLAKQRRAVHESILVDNVIIKQYEKEILYDTDELFIKK